MGYLIYSGSVVLADRMAELYVNGSVLSKIGKEYDLTRERVRQIIKKYSGMTGVDGGAVVRARRRAATAHATRDAHYLRKYGCMFDQWSSLRIIGRELMCSGGKGRDSSPTYAYSQQKNNARRRGIGWEMTLWEWWCIWKESGHWEERGRGIGYWMMRINISRTYAIDNVRIVTGRDGMRKNNFHRKAAS